MTKSGEMSAEIEPARGHDVGEFARGDKVIVQDLSLTGLSEFEDTLIELSAALSKVAAEDSISVSSNSESHKPPACDW